MESVEPFVDLVRLGWGTAYVSRELRRKLDVYRDHGVPTMLGGTLTELAWLQGRVDGLRAWLDELGHRPRRGLERRRRRCRRRRRLELIATLARDRTVYAEVGEKDPRALMAPYRWVALIREALEAGRDAGRLRGPRGRVAPACSAPTARSAPA